MNFECEVAFEHGHMEDTNDVWRVVTIFQLQDKDKQIIRWFSSEQDAMKCIANVKSGERLASVRKYKRVEV